MKEKIWKVGAYVRLSREDGDKAESESIGSQKEILRVFLRERKELVLFQEYADDGFSGVNFERPAFQRMMEDIRAKKIDCIICKDLSRFARNYIDAGRYLEKIFPFMGVRFIAVNDNYDSFGERAQSDSYIVPFKNLINDAYCRDISMKIRSQLEIRRKMGDFIGAFAVYGYKKDEADRHRLVVDKPAAQVVKLIFRLRLNGMSNSRIARRLNELGILSPMEYKQAEGMKYASGFRTNEKALWTPAAVLRILTNEVYLGTLIQHKRGTPNYKVKKEIAYDRRDWIVSDNRHEAVIDRMQFETVQSLLKRDIRVSPEKDTAPLFSGYLFCGDCGHSMVRKTVPSHGKTYHYYVCSAHKAGLGCSSHSFSEKKLNAIVLALVRDQIEQVSRLDEILDSVADLSENNVFRFDAQIEKLNGEIERFRERKQRLYDDFTDGIISREDYLEFRAGYDRKAEERRQTILRLEEERRQTAEKESDSLTWMGLFRQYETITELQRAVIVNLIERIMIYDSEHIEVVFRYQDRFDSAFRYAERLREKEA